MQDNKKENNIKNIANQRKTNVNCKPSGLKWIKCSVDACLNTKGKWGLYFIFINNKGDTMEA